MKKISVLLLLLSCLFAGSLISCEKTPAKVEEETTAETNGQSGSALLTLVQNGTVQVRLAYANGFQQESEKAISLLQKRFSSKYGVTVEDAVSWTQIGADDVCIVFGDVQNNTTEALYAQLRNNDYAIEVDGNQIYIAAYSESCFNQAANALLANLLVEEEESSAATVRLSGTYSAFLKGRYSLMNAQIGQSELMNFVLMKPEDELITSTVSTTLIENISKAYGYELPLKLRAEEGTPTVTMRIDDGMKPMQYGYRVENGNLVLVSGGPFSMYLAAQNIVSLLRPDATATGVTLDEGDSRIVSLLDNPDGLARPADTDLRVISCNAMANGFDPAFAGFSDTGEYTFEMRTEIFEALLEIYSPDIMGLQEVCPSWYNYFDAVTLTDSKWALSKGETSGSRAYFLQPILYRADKLTLVADGWVGHSSSYLQAWGGRYLSWAVFEVKASGERIAVVNAHWDGWSKPDKNPTQVTETLSLIKKLQADYGCRVVSTGDFNTPDIGSSSMSNQDYIAFLQDGTVKDGKYYTDHLVEDIGSVHGWGPDADPRVYSFDHIFCTADTRILQFCTAWDNYQAYASDHAWLIADIDLSATVSS